MPRRTLGNASTFGPWHVDSSKGAPPSTDEVRLSQWVLEVLASIDVYTAPPTPIIPPPDHGGTAAGGVNPSSGIDVCGTEVPLAWWEIQNGATVDRYAPQAIHVGDPKEPRVQSMGTIQRSVSDDTDALRGSIVAPVFIDTDRVLRARELADSLVGSRATAYISTEAAIRAGVAPRRVFDGQVADAEPQGELLFQLQIADFLAGFLDQFEKHTFPQRVFNVIDFPYLANSPDHPTLPGNPDMIGKPVPIAYGMLTDERTATAPGGVCPLVFTGRKTFPSHGSMLWDEFVLCGHAVKSVETYFSPTGPGLSQGTDYAGRIRHVPTGTITTWIVPGNAQYAAIVGGNYVERPGGRYTCIYGRGPESNLARSTTPLAANVVGIEDVGDGTGAPIDNLFEQIKHLLTNWILQNYKTGPWLSVPTVGAGADLYARINTASFDAVKAWWDAATPGGLLTAFLLGAKGEAHTFGEIFALCAKNGGYRHGINKDGQLIATVRDLTRTPVRRVTHVADVLEGTLAVKRRRDLIKNRVVYRYQPRYVVALPTWPDPAPPPSGEWGADNVTQEDAVSIAKYDVRENDLSLEFHREARCADAVALHQGLTPTPPTVTTFTEGPCGTAVDLGEVVTLTHPEGLGSTGYTDVAMQCVRHELDLDQFTVTEDHEQ